MANAWAAPVPGKTQNPTSGGEALSDPPTNSEKALLEKGSGPPNFLQDCFEKIELVDRVKDAMAKGITGGSASPSPATSATSATSATGSSPRTPPQDSLGLGFGKGQYLGWLAVSERSPRGASYTSGSWWRFQAFEQKRVSWNSGVFPYMLMRRIWQPEDISDAKNM